MIFCCGEALIDMLPRPIADEPIEGYLPVAGGSIFNTAIALGRLGEEIGLLAGLSNDLFGEQLVEALLASNVSLDFVSRSDQPSTLAFVKLVDGAAQYSFFDENSAMRMLKYSDIAVLPSHAKALQFGGISLTSDPCASTYEETLNATCDNSVIAIDPNIRTGFIRDEKSYRDRLGRMIAKSDIIKVSDEDLEWLQPGRSFEDVARGWIDAGSALVLQTLGPDGSRAVTGNHDIHVPGKKVEVVDTVGAGDTFNAGILSALKASGNLDKASMAQINETDLVAAVTYASAVAAYTVGQAGANPPRKDQVLS